MAPARTRFLHTLFLCTLLVFAGCESMARSGTGLWPIADGEKRLTPLHFGMYVTPDPGNNPIDPPERFTGYHVATDFEIFEGEAESDIPVFSVCKGKVAYSGIVEGYGGLLVQRCKIDGEDVTVLYGHLLVEPMPAEGTMLHRGQRISVLAPARSYESGWNRKHLHFGIRRGSTLDFRGYVQHEHEIGQYIDPQTVLPL